MGEGGGEGWSGEGIRRQRWRRMVQGVEVEVEV